MTIGEYWRKHTASIRPVTSAEARQRREDLRGVLRIAYMQGFMAGKTTYESYELLRVEAEERANAFVDARLPNA